MAANIKDKIFLSLAVLLVAGAGGIVSLQQKGFEPKLRFTGAAASTTAYKSINAQVPEVPTEELKKPDPQKEDGPNAIFEVFTSPRIFYYEGAFHFDQPTPPPPPPPFGVEFVQVRPDPFRLQLVGFSGEDGIFTVTWPANELDGETFLARKGKPLLDKLGLVLSDFAIKPVQVADLPEGSEPLSVMTAVAAVTDTKTGEVTTLTTQSRLVTGKPYGILKPIDGTALEPMKEGATFSTDHGRKYRIEKVTETPAVITVTKLSDDDPVFMGPETQELFVQPTIKPAPKTSAKSATSK